MAKKAKEKVLAVDETVKQYDSEGNVVREGVQKTIANEDGTTHKVTEWSNKNAKS